MDNDKYNCEWVDHLRPSGWRDGWAITIGQTTYYSVPLNAVDDRWLAHEQKHKQQWRTEGYFKFAIKYLWYHFTRGYEKNPYEIEARAYAER